MTKPLSPNKIRHRLLNATKNNDVYEALELATDIARSRLRDKESIIAIEACRDIIVASKDLNFYFHWLRRIPSNVVSQDPIEEVIKDQIESGNFIDVLDRYARSSAGPYPLSKETMKLLIKSLIDFVLNDPANITELNSRLCITAISKAINVDDLSDELYKEAEFAVLDSGNLDMIYLWDSMINNYGLIRQLFHISGISLKKLDSIKDVKIPVKDRFVSGTPFESSGLYVLNSGLYVDGQPLWWIDPDSFEADHVVSIPEWIAFIDSGMKPVRRMMPAPVSVRETGEWPWEEKMKEENKLRTLVGLMIERKMREADHSSGKKVPFGSSKHIKDLEKRIKELSLWRDKHKKGSEKRAHYARLISTLRQELGNARRIAEKNKKK